MARNALPISHELQSVALHIDVRTRPTTGDILSYGRVRIRPRAAFLLSVGRNRTNPVSRNEYPDDPSHSVCRLPRPFVPTGNCPCSLGRHAEHVAEFGIRQPAVAGLAGRSIIGHDRMLSAILPSRRV